MINPVAPAAGQGKGKGKGKGGAKRWQIKLENQWKDYDNQEDGILKRAYMMGQKNAKFHLRGQNYEYNFKKMKQKNKETGKEREIRPPPNFKAPKKPLLPEGPTTVITVAPNQAGTLVDIKDPMNPGKTVKVYVPPHAKPGQKLAVPIPQQGEDIADVQKKQEKHDQEHGTKTSWTTGGKVAAGTAAVGAAAAVGVGGVILGDHLAGGAMADTIGAEAVEAGEAVGDAATEAYGAAEDWAPGALEDAGDWLGDAGEDAGDFVMDLF